MKDSDRFKIHSISIEIEFKNLLTTVLLTLSVPSVNKKMALETKLRHLESGRSACEAEVLAHVADKNVMEKKKLIQVVKKMKIIME